MAGECVEYFFKQSEGLFVVVLEEVDVGVGCGLEAIEGTEGAVAMVCSWEMLADVDGGFDVCDG